jgi:hypothetical protein
VPVWRETGWNGPVTGWCDRLDGGVRRLQHGGIGFRVVRDRSFSRLHPEVSPMFPVAQRFGTGA